MLPASVAEAAATAPPAAGVSVIAEPKSASRETLGVDAGSVVGEDVLVHGGLLSGFAEDASHGGELWVLGVGTVPDDPAPDATELLAVLAGSYEPELGPPNEPGSESDPPNVDGPELGVLLGDVEALEGALELAAGRALAPSGAAAVRSLWQ